MSAARGLVFSSNRRSGPMILEGSQAIQSICCVSRVGASGATLAQWDLGPASTGEAIANAGVSCSRRNRATALFSYGTRRCR